MIPDQPPVLTTKRLLLRPFEISDAATVQKLAGDPKIYEMTTNIPHPYQGGMAETWIKSRLEEFQKGNGVFLGITLISSNELIGCISLGANPAHNRAELGYWIGVPYWNKGYCTEAAREIAKYGFNTLGYQKITSSHLEKNPMSGKVMQKIGMKQEGFLKNHILKDGKYNNLILYGIQSPNQ